MSEGQKKKDIFDRRPFGIPKRYIFCVVWCLATIATWFITHDVRKTIIVAIGAPFVVGLVSMVGMMILFFLNEMLNGIIPPRSHWIKWYILLPLWVVLPLYILIVRGSVEGALYVFVALPIMVFMLLWFLGLFGSWIVSACEVQNPILKILAIIGVLLIIGLMIAIGINSKGRGTDYDDYDQYDRGDPTYFRR